MSFPKYQESDFPFQWQKRQANPASFLPQAYTQINRFQMNNFPGLAVLRILETPDIDYKITENKAKIKPGTAAGQTHGDRLPSCAWGIFKVQAGLEPKIKIKKLANLKCYRSITSNSFSKRTLPSPGYTRPGTEQLLPARNQKALLTVWLQGWVTKSKSDSTELPNSS